MDSDEGCGLVVTDRLTLACPAPRPHVPKLKQKNTSPDIITTLFATCVKGHQDITDATRDGKKSETRNCVLLKFKKRRRKKLCAAALSVGAVLVQSEGGERE